MKIVLGVILAGLFGTFLVGVANEIFGVENVFYFSTIVTALVGIIYVPYLQYRAYKNRKRVTFLK
jgi:cell division protein FtsL